MHTAFFIAKRYFSTKSKGNLIYRMSLIACLSVALGTMALLIVLSIFNGLEGVVRRLFYAFDPDIKIELKQGKYFSISPELIHKIESVSEVTKVVEVIEENVLFTYHGHQLVAKLKGVSGNFVQDCTLAAHIIQGKLEIEQDGHNFALVGAGIQYALSIRLNNIFEELQVFYPKNNKLSALTAQNLYQTGWIKPGAIFAIEKHFDENYVIVPLNFATNLLGNSDKRTALEVQVMKGSSIAKVQKALQTFLPQEFKVLNRDEQQMTLMRTIRIERMLVFMTFAFIVIVASLNIFFILSMLVLAKRPDIAILYSLGATSRTIRNIFLLNGLLIGLSGALAGMLLAWFLAWLQQKFGIISMGMQTSLIEAYPVKRQISDFIYVGIGVFLTTLVASYRPALLASRINIREHL
ncbi:MAG: FtsX-like permease family protein [Candidatus Amoebophilus sp.]